MPTRLTLTREGPGPPGGERVAARIGEILAHRPTLLGLGEELRRGFDGELRADDLARRTSVALREWLAARRVARE